MIEYFSATKFLLLKTVKRWQKSRNKMRTVRRGIGLPEEYEIGIYWRVGARAKGRCGNHLHDSDDSQQVSIAGDGRWCWLSKDKELSSSTVDQEIS